MCLRNLGGDILNPDLEHANFDINWIDNLDVAINKLTLCGNYGDPIVHPKLHELVERWIERFNMPIIMMTNGGARDEEWWEKLAVIAQGKLTVVFGIDGLEDTNHLYRRHVSWPKLMSNCRSYINAGGNARWKFIIFKHNQHQIDRAKELSQQMGFSTFEQIVTNRFKKDRFDVVDRNGNTIYHLEEPMLDLSQFKSKNPNRNSQTREWSGTISCYAKKENSVYIAADGRVYPCCNVGYHFNDGKRGSFGSLIELQRAHQDNNINDLKLSQIVSGGFFKEIETRWKSTPLTKCVNTCGTLRDNLHKIG
jgi:MoaA/NifB/PqqE/SkfB family radical SAM enzyme